jgi:hypothetical protein
MKVITAITGQTLFDIALQEMGSVEGAFDILGINAFLRLDMSIPSGTQVLVPDKVINPAVVDYYVRNNVKPVSGLGEEIVLNLEDMINIPQVLMYDLSGGSRDFEGIRIWNLRDKITIQVEYHDFPDNVDLFIEQSLDGVQWDPIMLDGEPLKTILTSGDSSKTLNVTSLLTNFIRARVEVVDQTGIIDKIIWRV